MTSDRPDLPGRVVPAVGLAVGLLLPVLGFVVPRLVGWDVATRAPRSYVPHPVPPLHGYWHPTWFGPGTGPAVGLAILGWRYAAGLAERLAWPRLLAASYLTSLGWLLSLALVTGRAGIAGVLTSPYEYLPTARRVGGIHHLLESYVSRIPYSAAPHNWPTSVAGHPPGMLLFFVLLDRVGLGGDLTVGLVVVLVAASVVVAVLTTLRALDAEATARSAAPFLALAPTAVFMAVSADAVITAVVGWGLALLALAAAGVGRRRWAWAALAGLLLGGSALLSYGMPLMGLMALAVLLAARTWRPLPVAVVAAVVPVLVFAALGFRWWSAYPVLRQRYLDGISMDRPQRYWWWGDLGALLVSAGPLLGASLAVAAATALGAARRAHRVVLLLSGSAALAVGLADASGMSKGEVERIWLPFAPWLLLTVTLLPQRWRRWGLALQLATALLVEHLLNTAW